MGVSPDPALLLARCTVAPSGPLRLPWRVAAKRSDNVMVMLRFRGLARCEPVPGLWAVSGPAERPPGGTTSSPQRWQHQRTAAAGAPARPLRRRHLIENDGSPPRSAPAAPDARLLRVQSFGLHVPGGPPMHSRSAQHCSSDVQDAPSSVHSAA